MAKKFPEIKKDLKMFLSSEEAKMTKKNAFRLGAGIMLTLGVAKQVLAQHGSAIDNTAAHRGRHVSHSSHGSHASHGSHGSHGQW